MHVSVCRQPRGIVIEVRDEGCGIPRHEQHEIFDKFVRGGQAERWESREPVWGWRSSLTSCAHTAGRSRSSPKKVRAAHSALFARSTRDSDQSRTLHTAQSG